jgi:hypothetical protein
MTRSLIYHRPFVICHKNELQANPSPFASLATRSLLVITSIMLLSVSAFAGSDFNGEWVLDLRSSSSPEPILKRLGASWIERQLGGVVQMKATYKQTPDLLTVTLQGPGFRRTDVMHINNQPETKQDSRTGRYTIRTFWSANGTQLNSTISFRTKDSRDAQLTIVRELVDGGKTLTLNGILKIAAERETYTLRRVWRKRVS